MIASGRRSRVPLYTRRQRKRLVVVLAGVTALALAVSGTYLLTGAEPEVVVAEDAVGVIGPGDDPRSAPPSSWASGRLGVPHRPGQRRLGPDQPRTRVLPFRGGGRRGKRGARRPRITTRGSACGDRLKRLRLEVLSICKHNASMPNVLVRDLPDDVHAALQRKAERRHQSLQQYLAAELRHLAERQQISDVLDDIDTHQGGRVGLRQAVADISEERSRR